MGIETWFRRLHENVLLGSEDNMARVHGRIIIGFMALLVLMTGIVAAGQAPALATSVAADEPDTTVIAHAGQADFGLAIEPNTTIIAHAGQADFGLAMLSILLGGGMFYLFRPIRRVPVDIRS